VRTLKRKALNLAGLQYIIKSPYHHIDITSLDAALAGIDPNTPVTIVVHRNTWENPRREMRVIAGIAAKTVRDYAHRSATASVMWSIAGGATGITRGRAS
jgi:precorrin-4 methylase